MAGYRIRRKTSANNFIAANGTLTLPWAYSNSVDDGTNGVFHEFFYNFSRLGLNMDIGILFRGVNGWHIFAYGSNVVNGWYDRNIALSAGQSIECAVYTEEDNVILKVNGIAHYIPVISGTAAKLRLGCSVSREANLVPQKKEEDLTPCWLLQTNAYFVGAAWSEMTLTTTSGSYVKMNTSNSTLDTKLDSGDPTILDENCFSYTSTTVNGFVKDNCTIDFRERNKNLCN